MYELIGYLYLPIVATFHTSCLDTRFLFKEFKLFISIEIPTYYVKLV